MVTDQQMLPMAVQPPVQGPMTPTVPDKAHVEKFIIWWTDRINAARKFHDPAFKKMYTGSELAAGNTWENAIENDERYECNIIQSEIAASVSVLYAKNPSFYAKRRPRMDFAIWDETPDSLMQAQMQVQQAMVMGLPPMPDVQALLDDIVQGYKYREMMDRIAKTLEVVFRQQLAQQQPNFKDEMKALVRRTETTGVGYMKLDYQRLMDVKPEAAARIADTAAQIAHLEGLMKTVTDDKIVDYDRQAEELRIALKSLQEKELTIIREGLLVHFPKSTSIIPDPACSQLRGFVGARWVAEEFHLTADKIQSIYKVDVLDKSAKTYGAQRVRGVDEWRPNAKADGTTKEYDDMYRIWEVYHLDTGSTFTICEGLTEYLKEPGAPKVMLERFYPYYTLTFNDVEDDRCIFPPSTAWMLRHQQKERNRSREALRQHRIASKPHYVSASGTLTQKDLTNMEAAPAHAIIQVDGLQPSQKVGELFQQVQKHGIDQNVYETASIDGDVQRITRRNDAAMGIIAANATATENTIAADSRQVEDRSKSDDIDGLLTAFARDAGQTLLLQMDAQSVRKIAGPGAAWPQGDPSDIVNDLYLEIEAGSSGRPNRALEVANFQRLFPILVQIPGMKPTWLAKTAVKLADSNIDLSEAYLEGLPSIMSLNKMAQTGTGNPETDPTAQGGEGGDKDQRLPDEGNQLAVSPGLNAQPELATENSILQ